MKPIVTAIEHRNQLYVLTEDAMFRMEGDKMVPVRFVVEEESKDHLLSIDDIVRLYGRKKYSYGETIAINNKYPHYDIHWSLGYIADPSQEERYSLGQVGLKI